MKEKFHFMSLSDGQVKLDDFEVRGVEEYRLEHGAAMCPTLTLVIAIEGYELQSQPFSDNSNSDLTDDI